MSLWVRLVYRFFPIRCDLFVRAGVEALVGISREFVREKLIEEALPREPLPLELSASVRLKVPTVFL
jgi:hypothetical protein